MINLKKIATACSVTALLSTTSLSVADAETSKVSDEECKGVVKTYSLLSRAQFLCHYTNFSQDLINGAGLCSKRLGPDQTKVLLETGFRDFEAMKAKVGQNTVCEGLLVAFPKHIRNSSVPEKPSDGRKKAVGLLQLQAYSSSSSYCLPNVRLYNNTDQLVDQVSMTVEVIGNYDARYLSHLSFNLVEPGRDRETTSFGPTGPCNHGSLRIMSIDKCVIGGNVYDDCEAILATPLPPPDTTYGAMIVKYEPIHR